MENVVAGGEGRQNRGAPLRNPAPDGRFSTLVNGVRVAFTGPEPNGEHILNKAGFDPTSDFALIQLLRHGTRLIGLDETVDLRMPGTEELRAFKTDRVFRFILNGHDYEWGANKIPEPELRLIGHAREDEVIVLDREGHDIDLGPADVLDLAAPGTEHLHTEKRLITVFYENEPREIPRGVYTTEQFEKLFGVQEGYILEYINREGRLTPLKRGETLRVKDGMKFFEQVPCGGSS